MDVTAAQLKKHVRRAPLACLPAMPVIQWPFTREIDNMWAPNGGNHLTQVVPGVYILLDVQGELTYWHVQDEGPVHMYPIEQIAGCCPNVQAQLLRQRVNQSKATLLCDMGFSPETCHSLLEGAGDSALSAIWCLIDVLTEKHEEFSSLCDFFFDSVSAADREAQEILECWQSAGIIVHTIDDNSSSALISVIKLVLADDASREALRNLCEPEVIISA